MARRRFFVDHVHNGKAVLEGDAAEHLRRVLRAEPGVCYELSDNESVYLAEIESIQKKTVQFRILEPLPVEIQVPRVTLLASLVKFERFEWIVEKATELGADRIVPVAAARSEKGLEQAAARRLERWRRIALESSQQSRRARLPVIDGCVPFPFALQAAGAVRCFLDEDRDGPGLLAALPSERRAGDTVAILAGPEGGWTDSERAEAVAAGWKRVSLGPLILRAETAVIAALAVVNARWIDAQT